MSKQQVVAKIDKCLDEMLGKPISQERDLRKDATYRVASCHLKRSLHACKP